MTKQLVQLHEEYAEKGLSIVAVHVTKNSDEKQIRRYIKKHKLPYKVALDQQQAAMSAWGVSGIPHMFLIDGTGTIIWDGREINERVRRLIESELRQDGAQPT